MDVSITIDRVSPVPLYHQLSRQLKSAIVDGHLPKGAYLGNEVLLAQRWQVSRPTVRRAIQDLVDDGLLVRRRGVGTQVVNDQVRRPFALSSLWEDLAAAGRRPVTKVISIDSVPADHGIAEALDVAVASDMTAIVRLRSDGRQRLAVLRNWIVADVAERARLTVSDLESAGLYAILRDAGVRPHSALQRLGAKVATHEEADLLGVDRGAPLVTMRRVMQDDTGRRVELGDHVYDAAHYSVEMSVVEN